MEARRAEKEGVFLLTPLREGRLLSSNSMPPITNFYSRPCGRGDRHGRNESCSAPYFYSRPCGRGDPRALGRDSAAKYFYSRPCGRGDILHC